MEKIGKFNHRTLTFQKGSLNNVSFLETWKELAENRIAASELGGTLIHLLIVKTVCHLLDVYTLELLKLLSCGLVSWYEFYTMAI